MPSRPADSPPRYCLLCNRPRHKPRYIHRYSGQYSTATPRQLHNLRAYERGEFYETYSEALPVGSRPWFEAKEREGGFRRF